jgi:hypothetical protein
MLDEIGVLGGWGARPRLGSWVRERGPGGTNLKAKESARVVLGTTGPGHCRCWDSGELGSWSSDAECGCNDPSCQGVYHATVYP